MHHVLFFTFLYCIWGLSSGSSREENKKKEITAAESTSLARHLKLSGAASLKMSRPSKKPVLVHFQRSSTISLVELSPHEVDRFTDGRVVAQ